MLDLRDISTFTDFFVICSGSSEPQLKAIANEIETRLREDHSVRPVAIDGFPASQWMVLDFLQVVVHIFHQDKRAFYSLEDLCATIISAMARTAEYPLTQPVASLSANPARQVLEPAWRPVVLLQKSEPRWDRSLD